MCLVWVGRPEETSVHTVDEGREHQSIVIVPTGPEFLVVSQTDLPSSKQTFNNRGTSSPPFSSGFSIGRWLSPSSSIVASLFHYVEYDRRIDLPKIVQRLISTTRVSSTRTQDYFDK